MSEKPNTLELLNNVGLELAKPGLKSLLISLGLDERTAEATSSAFAETVKWSTALFLKNPDTNIRSQERLEYERFSEYMEFLASFARSNQAYIEIDKKLEENPELIGLLDRIVRNVEQESSRRKIQYYANLTHSAIIGPARSWRVEEKINYAKYILEMSEIDFLILGIGQFHMLGQFTEDDGAVHGLFGDDSVSLADIRTRLNPEAEILRKNPTASLPDGLVDAALNRLVNFGFLHRSLPIKLSGETNSYDPDVKFKMTASGMRFHNWCLVEAQ